MNRVKAIKIVSIILMISIFTLFLSTKVFAASEASDIIVGLKPTYEDEAGLTNVGQQIISIISTVAIVISVIVLLIIGIKYMMGSASEKAEYKKTMIPYLVGAVIIFGAGAIAQVVVNLATSITSETGGAN